MYFWTEAETAFLADNYQKLSAQSIAVELGKSASAVEGRCHRLGLHKSSKKYHHNETFFSSPNNLNSYWAGLVAADGWVRKIGNADYMFLALKADDKYHVEHFARDLGYDGVVKDRLTVCNGKPYSSAIVEICSCSRLVEDLVSHFGVHARKSLTLAPPTLSELNHKLAFIAGYIDGDGCIREDEKGRLEVSMVGTLEMLKWIQMTFDEIVPPQGKYHAVARERSNRNISEYKVTGYRAVFIMEKLLAVDTPKLKRKWDVVRKIVREFEVSDRKNYVNTWIDRLCAIDRCKD